MFFTLAANVYVYDGLGLRTASLSPLLNEINKSKRQTNTEPQADINILLGAGDLLFCRQPGRSQTKKSHDILHEASHLKVRSQTTKKSAEENIFKVQKSAALHFQRSATLSSK